MAQVRDHDAPTDDEGDVESIVEFGVAEPGLDALPEVVVDAVVAAQHGAGDEAEQFLRPPIEGAVAVGRRVEGEEAPDADVVLLVEDSAVHPGAMRLEGGETVRRRG